jgi:hypothetical protein
MCLVNSKDDVKKFIKKYKEKNKTYVWLYKRVEFDGKNLIGIHRSKYKYKAGWNKSNSKRKTPCYENANISLGIHVSNKVISSLGIPIKVKCYIKDLIGVSELYSDNYSNTWRGYQELVFSKIWIPKKTYDKIIKDFKKES